MTTSIRAAATSTSCWGGKLVEPAGECRSNHDVICALAERLGAQHRGFDMTPREIVDWTLREVAAARSTSSIANEFLDVQPDFRTAHYLDGFGYRDRKFRFKPDWPKVPNANAGPVGPWREMPVAARPVGRCSTMSTPTYPFKLATLAVAQLPQLDLRGDPVLPQARGRPEVMINPADADRLGIATGAKVQLGSPRGTVILHAKVTDQTRPGVVIAESIWANADHEARPRHQHADRRRCGPAPFGGAAFHDNKVWIKKA
jgi:anaerobic selenocysteine-containing dehydrogenase